MQEHEQIQEQIQELLEAFFSGRIRPEERRRLAQLADSADYDAAVSAVLEKNFYKEADARGTTMEEAALFVEKMRPRMKEKKTPVRYFLRVAAAAVFIGAIATTYLLVNKKELVTTVAYKGDVAPGITGSRIRLADGRMVLMDTLKDGLIAMQGSYRVMKQNGKIVYERTDAESTHEILYNEVFAERGRQSEAVVLPDGSTAWLNAGSSLRYPLEFGRAERAVAMTGEIYFEVAHNAKQPFKVRAGNTVIEDIGTSFNVNAYSDEPAMVATLLEGAIRIGDKILSPGQQYSNGIIKNVDTDKATAWHKGLFSFDHGDIPAVMRQLARWYNVDIQFEGKIPDETFSGKMGRDLSLAEALDALKKKHVRFRIEEDRRVVISDK